MEVLQAGQTYLRDIPLFAELETAQLRKITSISRVVRIKKNSVIFNSGDVYRGFYIVLKGSVKVFKISSAAKETILHIIKPFSIFADVPLFEEKNYPVNAMTLEDSVLLFIPGDEFLCLLESDSRICLKMLAGFARKMKALTQRFDELSRKEVTGRLAEFIIEELQKGKKTNLNPPLLRLNMSKSTIASYLGTITETLSRAFRRLQNENIIRVDGRKIIIINYQKLKELASE